LKGPFRTPKLLAVIGLVGFLAGSATLQMPLNAQREQYKLTHVTVLENAPPELVIATQALGGFRGILVDFLWVRAIDLQENGKFFELVQLYDWIGKLQPKLPEVWIKNAHNMTYNISVELPVAERWPWVERGIKILQNEGLKYNRTVPQIYHEIAWSFFHKIGGDEDLAHFIYKEKMARRMMDILGDDPDIEAIGSAPTDAKVLLEDEQVKGLVDAFEADGVDLLEDFFKIRRAPDEFPEKLVSRLEEPARAEAVKSILVFSQAKRLRGEWTMDPKFLAEVDKEYGPLDWRLPYAHAIYWAAMGLPYAVEDPTRVEYRTQQLERDIYFALTDIATRRGIVVFVGEGLPPMYFADIRQLDRVDTILKDMIAQPEIWLTRGTTRGVDYLQSAHENFLNNAALLCYQYNDLELAVKYVKEAADLYPSTKYRQAFPLYMRTLLDELYSTASQTEMLQHVHSFLMRSYMALAGRQYGRYQGLRNTAEKMYNRHQEQNAGQANRLLPPWNRLDNVALQMTLRMLPPALQKQLREDLNLPEPSEESPESSNAPSP